MTRDLRLVGFALLFWGIGEGLFIYFLLCTWSNWVRILSRSGATWA